MRDRLQQTVRRVIGRWVSNTHRRRPMIIPVVVEACAMSLGGFLIGLTLAYLVELRRRANAEWRW